MGLLNTSVPGNSGKPLEIILFTEDLCFAETHHGTYQAMAGACAGFPRLLVYIPNMYRATEPFHFWSQ